MNRIRLIISIVALLAVLFVGIVSTTERVHARDAYCECTTIWGADGVRDGSACVRYRCIIVTK